jgi:nucleotide-binding universal stress UspA family protein
LKEENAMRNDDRVMACVDPSHYAEPVADYAAWAARRLGTGVEFLHVLEAPTVPERGTDHSGSLGVDAQEHLLKELADQGEAHSRARREAGRVFLNALRERALAAGVTEVDVRQRHGSLAETLSEQQAQVSLFVLGRRGGSAGLTGRDLGRNLEWAIRAVDKPVLAVTDRFLEPTRVLLAFDGSALMRRGVQMIASNRLLKGLPVHVLMAGKPDAQAPATVEWAGQALATAGFSVTQAIVPGDPERVISQVAQERGADLVVMGAYSHSPLRSWLVGSRTTDLLRSVRVAALLLR